MTQQRRTHQRQRQQPAAPQKGRIVLAMLAFTLVYGGIGARLVTLGLEPKPVHAAYVTAQDSVAAARPDIVDRNGEILATDLSGASLYAEPRRIIDVDEAIEALATVLPEVATADTRRKLSSGAGFVWLKREITARQRQAIHDLGIPGIDFLNENKRFYPGGATAGHVLGHVNIDNQGIAGIEKHIDDRGLAALHQMGFARTGKSLEPVELSLDLRVQHAVRDELTMAMERYEAIAAIGIVLDVDTGEVLAMTSLPEYDPNNPVEALEKDRMNRATAGTFEMGSVFKTFTTAMALDSGKVSLSDSFDARFPLRYARHTIRDFHGKGRWLSVPEVFIYSSNIGTAKMAMTAGVEQQRAFLKRIGMLDRLETELPEVAHPIVPQKWSQISGITISFGHGLAVTPMHTAVGAAALLNGGYLVSPTFFRRTEADARAAAKQVVSAETSLAMRKLFRLNALKGSGRRARVPGFRVGGKTGTAEKVVNGAYSSNKRFNSFLAAFPMDDPRYVVLVVLDEPQPEKGQSSATAGLNAAPTVANIVSRIGPMLKVEPDFEEPVETRLAAFDY